MIVDLGARDRLDLIICMSLWISLGLRMTPIEYIAVIFMRGCEYMTYQIRITSRKLLTLFLQIQRNRCLMFLGPGPCWEQQRIVS